MTDQKDQKQDWEVGQIQKSLGPVTVMNNARAAIDEAEAALAALAALAELDRAVKKNAAKTDGSKEE